MEGRREPCETAFMIVSLGPSIELRVFPKEVGSLIT